MSTPTSGYPFVASAGDGQDFGDRIDDLEDDAFFERARRRKEAERRKELEKRQQAMEESLKRQEDAMRRQEDARKSQIEIERQARKEKIKREKEEAEFKLLKDMAEKNPNSKHSKLYEIEVLRRAGEISNYQANSRKNYVLSGPGGGIGVKKGGGITLTEEITDPTMKARGLKKGQTFVDD